MSKVCIYISFNLVVSSNFKEFFLQAFGLNQMLPKPTCHSEYCIFCSHGWFSCFMVLNALFSRVFSVPFSNLSQYRTANTVLLICIGYLPNSLRANVVLAYLDTPGENLQKLMYNLSTAFGTLFISSIVKVAGFAYS